MILNSGPNNSDQMYTYEDAASKAGDAKTMAIADGSAEGTPVAANAAELEGNYNAMFQWALNASQATLEALKKQQKNADAAR